MRELGLTGLSEDKRYLVAHDALTDEMFRIPTDLRLTSLLDACSSTSSDEAVTRSDREVGARESTMETTLSPRDIQAKIRRGASPEEVAEESGMPLEKVRGFAVPVIAEREYIVEQARRTSVRRLHSSGAPGMQLGSLVDAGLVAAGASAESAAWDSWRREDGRWAIVVSPEGALGPVTFLYDAKGRYALPADDAAHELVGDVAQEVVNDPAPAPSVAEAPAELEPEFEMVQTVETVEVTLTGDATPADASTAAEIIERSAAIWSLKEARDRRALEQLALSIEAGPEAPSEMADVEITERQNVAVPATPPPPAHPSTGGSSKKRHERRRVPSWDEIMFGGGTQQHD